MLDFPPPCNGWVGNGKMLPKSPSTIASHRATTNVIGDYLFPTTPQRTQDMRASKTREASTRGTQSPTETTI